MKHFRTIKADDIDELVMCAEAEGFIDELVMYAEADNGNPEDDNATFNQYLISDLLDELYAAEDACGFVNDDSNAFLAVYNWHLSDIDNDTTTEYTESQLVYTANAMLQFAIDCYTDDYKYSDEYNAYINVNLH